MGAVAYVELSAVERADQHRPSKPTFAQRCVGMGAVVFDGMELTAYSAHDDAVTADVGERSQLTVGQVRQVAKISRFGRVSSVAQESNGPIAR